MVGSKPNFNAICVENVELTARKGNNFCVGKSVIAKGAFFFRFEVGLILVVIDFYVSYCYLVLALRVVLRLIIDERVKV